MRKRNIGKAIMLAAALAGSAAPAMTAPAIQAAPSCIRSADIKPVVRFALPLVIEGMAAACGGMLAADDFLPRSGTGLAARYRGESPESWAAARGVIERAMGDKLPAGLSGDTERMLVTDILHGMISSKLKVRDCVMANRIVETLAPLPLDNMSELAVLLIEIGVRDRAGKASASPLALCPTEGTR